MGGLQVYVTDIDPNPRQRAARGSVESGFLRLSTDGGLQLARLGWSKSSSRTSYSVIPTRSSSTTENRFDSESLCGCSSGCTPPYPRSNSSTTTRVASRLYRILHAQQRGIPPQPCGRRGSPVRCLGGGGSRHILERRTRIGEAGPAARVSAALISEPLPEAAPLRLHCGNRSHSRVTASNHPARKRQR
jgi:hypothetical protein